MDVSDTPPPDAKHDIRWEQLDKQRFFFFGTTFFFGVRALVYPSTVVKTRLQVSKNSNVGSFRMFTGILRKEGVFALYRGFPVQALGVIPAQAVYLSSYEIIRSRVYKLTEGKLETLQQRNLTSNIIGGALASLCSQFVVVPIDVVSQRMMLHSVEKNARKSSSQNTLMVVKNMIRTEGLRGFYRGFFSSIITYIPSSAAWWGTYDFVKQMLANSSVIDSSKAYLKTQKKSSSYSISPDPDHLVNLFSQALSAMAAASVSVTLTQPMDVIKTNIQTANAESSAMARMSYVQMASKLIRTEGIAVLGKGWTARLLSAAPVSTLMIVVYELVKRLSLKDEYLIPNTTSSSSTSASSSSTSSTTTSSPAAATSQSSTTSTTHHSHLPSGSL